MQLEFALTHTRASDPITSFDAAVSVEQTAQDQCARVLAALKAMGRGGAEQIGARVGMDGYRVRKRLADLEHAGLAVPTDETRKTTGGRSERIWVPL